jgi:hypothetical protein
MAAWGAIWPPLRTTVLEDRHNNSFTLETGYDSIIALAEEEEDVTLENRERLNRQKNRTIAKEEQIITASKNSRHKSEDFEKSR